MPAPDVMERLVSAVQDLSQARDIASIAEIVRKAARELTGADGATFVLHDSDHCHYLDENAIAPLWKGKRFPLETCISGWVMLNAQAAVVPDIYVDPRIPHDAYRPTFVKSLAMVPIRKAAPIAAIGNYWAEHHEATPAELEVLQALADTTSVAMENARLYGELQNKIDVLARREERIRQQRDALDVFTRSLAHDLREPVRTVRSFSGMMVANQLPQDVVHDYLRFVHDAGERMEMLIDAVFHYSQLDDPDSLRTERFALGEAVEGAQANLAALIQERGATVLSEQLPKVTANRVHMVQVFQNLISNAIQHSQRPVTIRIGAEQKESGWRICVQDDGPGIAPENRQRIFEPFKRLTRSDAHSGLGLAICNKIVALHGGKMECESELGLWSAFYFTLPEGEGAKETIVPAAPPRAAAATASQSVATVLLVDDRDADVRLTRAMLGPPVGMKCDFLVANDGRAALALLRDMRDRAKPVDLILLDINMPVMDGFEMLEQMGADPALREIPVVMCSGSTYQRDKDRAASLGAVGYLEKPPRFENLKPILEASSVVRLVHEDGERPTLMRAAG